MKLILTLSVGILLSSCAQLPEPVNGWIDIPLSENTFSESELEYRSDTIEIPLYAYDALEYKLGIAEGDTITYEWEVEMADPQLLEVEFHGHTERVGDDPGLLMFYKIHNEGEESGTLTAPFSGIHGWYLNNQSEEDIVVSLRVAGFYTLIEQ
ncbi:MAG: hypothetical protein CMP91_05055 [Gammaproteobacteria bacterium]|nr:hypothetical protein [Gammaproteobacteria bacterium]MAY02146.1 hypothetical protein [Gammaproteobacteria bacterium]|tara:strand:+ start:435 stop:893 length:459 start_codon:yes stop_codon:yes gene_type:complete